MTRAWLLLFVTLALAAPAGAQEEPEDTGDVPVETDAASTDEPAAEEVEADETAAEEQSPAEPWQLYAGVDYVVNTLSVSGAEAEEFDTGMYRLRFGKRAFESVGLELHYGVDNSDEGPADVETESYYGVFVVPTATLFETLEIAFPVGYAHTSVGGSGANGDFGSLAYGADAELPLRAFAESLPDVRLTAGGMVYYQKSDARLYGLNMGLRYDFTTQSLGNPFAWIGGIDLWPFGDDEDAAPAE